MRSTVLTVIILTLFAAAGAFASDPLGPGQVDDPNEWIPAAGSWRAVGNALVQTDTGELLARADREAPHAGVYELEFNVRYQDGGYRSLEAARQGEFHGGFGIHIGADEVPLGSRTWGAGESYLLWLNLDTRSRTAIEYPEHYGMRAQVYRSESSTEMELVENVDIAEMLGLSVADLEPFLHMDVPVRLRVDNRSGEVRVYDPTMPNVYAWLELEPGTLNGRYISLRTNSLSAGFSNMQARPAN